jgi:hypothetical protein
VTDVVSHETYGQASENEKWARQELENRERAVLDTIQGPRFTLAISVVTSAAITQRMRAGGIG